MEGRLTISPPELAPVCEGDQLELNCTVTGSVIEWRITPEQNHSQLLISALRYIIQQEIIHFCMVIL